MVGEEVGEKERLISLPSRPEVAQAHGGAEEAVNDVMTVDLYSIRTRESLLFIGMTAASSIT